MEAENVLLEKEDEDFLQKYYSVSQCLEENFLSLLCLAQSVPNNTHDFPSEVKDVRIEMLSNRVELDVPYSKYLHIYVRMHVYKSTSLAALTVSVSERFIRQIHTLSSCAC